MNIVLQSSAGDVADWRDAFARLLPDAHVACWPAITPTVDYLAVWKPSADLFTRVPSPKAIFNLGAGVDALLCVPTLPPDVPVIRLEDAGMAEQMGEYVMLAVLAAFREQAVYATQQRAARWGPRPRLAKDAFGVGLLGLGVLGQGVARALAPIGFPLRGWSRSAKAVPGVRVFTGIGELPAFLALSQVLVCLLPSTGDTRNLLDRTQLAQLPRGAHVVNIARGDIVVDADLVALVDDGHLAGATLDVFRDEPLPPEHPFWHHPRITVTPHVAALTLIEDSAAQVAAKIRRIEQGLPVTGVVERAREY